MWCGLPGIRLVVSPEAHVRALAGAGRRESGAAGRREKPAVAQVWAHQPAGAGWWLAVAGLPRRVGPGGERW